MKDFSSFEVDEKFVGTNAEVDLNEAEFGQRLRKPNPVHQRRGYTKPSRVLHPSVATDTLLLTRKPVSEKALWVQNSLNRLLGLRLPLNGIIGAETRSAIRSFQQKQNLPVDGIVGPETERALIQANQKVAVEDSESTSEELEVTTSSYVSWVQRSLNQVMGLKLAVDGIIGTQTRSAIRAFQQQKGLTADGIVGPKTEAALIASGAEPPNKTSSNTSNTFAPFLNRNSPGYIRWTQLALNRLLGLRLKVDGISGTETRSALRSFQQKQGLNATGAVEPTTEASLLANFYTSLPKTTHQHPTTRALQQEISIARIKIPTQPFFIRSQQKLCSPRQDNIEDPNSFINQKADQIRSLLDQADYRGAFYILNGLRMFDILLTLRALKRRPATGRDYIDELIQNIDAAKEFYKDRLQIALEIVKKGTLLDLPSMADQPLPTNLVDLANYLLEALKRSQPLWYQIFSMMDKFSKLPEDQRTEIFAFTSWMNGWYSLPVITRSIAERIQVVMQGNTPKLIKPMIKNPPQLNDEQKMVLEYIKRERDSIVPPPPQLVFEKGADIGYRYNGCSSADSTPTILNSSNQTRRDQINQIIWKELRTEGGASAINTYDGQILSWGMGFASGGGLKPLIKRLCQKDPTACSRLREAGFKLENDKWFVVDTETGYVEQEKDGLRLIQIDRGMLSLLIRIAEHRDHHQSFVDAQFELMLEKAAPPTGLGIEQWNDNSIALVTHLVWLRSVAGWRAYAATNGDVKQILHIFVRSLGITPDPNRGSAVFVGEKDPYITIAVTSMANGLAKTVMSLAPLPQAATTPGDSLRGHVFFKVPKSSNYYQLTP